MKPLQAIIRRALRNISFIIQPVIEEPADDLAEKLDNLQIVEADDDDIAACKVCWNV